MSGQPGPVPRTPDGMRRDAASILARLEYLTLAGGSFAATLLALVVPGMPTVPFLLATSYFLARSSPWLDEKLRQTAFLGPIITEWEEFGGLSRRSKDKLIGLTGVILVVTIILTPLSPLSIAVIIVLWLLGVYGVSRMPALSPEAEARLYPRRPARRALAKA